MGEPGQGQQQEPGQGQQQEPGQQEPAGTDSGARLDALERKLDALMARLGGGPGQSGPGSAAGKSIAEQVREGIAELEAERARREGAEAADAERKALAERVKALEETPPGPPDTWATRLQRRLYGQNPDGSPVTRARAGAGK